jgi:diguanylate cyclase (GGDEF)-like protein
MGDQNKSFLRQLESLWHGELLYEDEGINYTIDGDEIHVHLQFSVCHGYEESWSLIQVALLDITARKKAEAELAFLGTHDVLTQLTNRSFYTYALERLERDEFYPVTLIIIDINGLKSANDSLGHEAGDELLRRAGQILSAAVEPPWHASRLGGDEFAIVMPGADEGDGAALIERIQAMVDEVNRSCSSLALSLSLASATRQPSERLNDVAGRADKLMYSAKRLFYRQRNNDRRLARH